MSIEGRSPSSEQPITAEWNGSSIHVHDLDGIVEAAAVNPTTIYNSDDFPYPIKHVQVTATHKYSYKTLGNRPPTNWSRGQAGRALPSSPDSSYGSHLVDDYWKMRGGIDDEVAAHLERVEPKMERHKKSATMGKFAVEEVAARAFYDIMVRPFLLKGNLNSSTKEKAFSPDEAYVDNFVASMLDNGAVSQMYIRLLQSRPGEKPTDSRIGYGALELLRTWAIRTRVAKKLGLDYSVNIVDETEAFDQGEQIGFTAEAITDSYDAMRYLLDRYGLGESDIRLTPFSNQASLYRGGENRDDDLAKEYEQLLESNIERTLEDIRLGVFSLSAIRVVMIHRLRHGDGFTSVSANRDFEYLTDFHQDNIDKTLSVSESFNSALQMRKAAKRHIGQAGLEGAFPEFFNNATVLHWGISKKGDRVSIQPNFKVYQGRLVTPGYALPVYGNDNQFLGLTSYSDHTTEGFDVVDGPNSLPTALIKRE
ncbi:MAG: hypothetical protein JWL85_776 [Candidatus Saccharibacteria bacterium]|nr:hypothetical protein [Candidatus Saccharibacteria bacterium]